MIDPLELIPLGGLGEFGMNLMLVRHGTDCVIVDTGMMFPGAEHPGVDVIIPNLDYLEDCGTIHGVLLTHGHEDHIGALPWVLDRRDVPVYAAPFTAGLVRRRLDRHDLPWRDSLRDLPLETGALELGPFRIETLPVAHSIPQTAMLALHTPAGVVVHTADFKLDPDPLDGVTLDLRRLDALGDAGVLALLSDSTNADRSGFTPGERAAGAGLAAQFDGAPARVFVTLFSSNIYRIQQVADLAARHGRRLAIVGTSLENQVAVASRLGLLGIPAGLRVSAERAMELPAERVALLVTGSQGEPMSALSRIAVGRHREIRIEDDDLLLHSARIIPGNEKNIHRLFDHLLRRGANIVTAADAPIHVSGHPAREELRQVLLRLRPRYLIPIHGAYSQLKAHADLAIEAGLDPERIVLAETGDRIVVDGNACAVRDRVPVGHVFIDSALDEVDLDILRDRRRIAGDGIVVPVVAVDRETGAIGDSPEIVTRGFVPESYDNGLLEEARALIVALLDEATAEERSDEGLLRAKIQTELKRFVRRKTQRRPLIIPVIVEF